MPPIESGWPERHALVVRQLLDSWRLRTWSLISQHDRWKNHPWLFPAALMITVIALFFDCVGPHSVFAYRDAAHFYPPLYALVKNEWLSGRVPLWNPLLNAGQPLAAMATAGAFYPPQIILSLLMPTPMAVNVYGILHLALAATGGYALGRQQGLSRLASTVAGLAYGFSGSVLFQVYNPIYTAGAAWLVWAITAGWWLVHGGGRRAMGVLAMTLALAVLAGDPQAAYHAGLVLGGAVLMLRRPLWKSTGWLLAAAGMAGMMALVQIALADEFMQETTRGLDIVPQSIWQLPAFFARQGQSAVEARWYDIFIGRAPVGATHYHDTYSFALAPWRILEAVWPGFSGRIWSRWTMVAELETRFAWAASIYAGLLVAVLVAASFGKQRRDAAYRLWLFIGVISLLAACGGYVGIGLGRNALLLATGQSREIGFQYGDEVASVYWWLATFLPGYGGFRYPAKWLTVLALAVGQIAGHGVDCLAHAAFRRRAASITGWLGIAVAAGMIVGIVTLAKVFGAVITASDWQYRPALIGGLAGGLQAVTVAACLWVVLRTRRPPGMLLLMVLIADLVVSGRLELIVGDHRRLVQGGSYLRSLARDRLPQLEAVSPQMRIAVFNSQKPMAALRLSSDNYLGYLGTTQLGHSPWLFGCGVIGERSTAMPADAEILAMPLMENGAVVQPRRIKDLSGVELFVIANADDVVADTNACTTDWSARQFKGEFEGSAPKGDPLPGKAFRLPGVEDGPPMVYALRNESALPRARIVRNAVIVPALDRADRKRRFDLLKRIAFPDPVLPNLVDYVVIEGEPEGVEATVASTRSMAAMASDSCRIVIDEPQKVVVEATLAEPGYVVLADSFHQDWALSVTTADRPAENMPILRANRLHRACRLPAGRHRLEYQYHSATFSRTVWVSLVGWAVAIAAILPRSRPKIASEQLRRARRWPK